MWATERTARSTCDHTMASYAAGRRIQGDREGLSNGDISRAETPRSVASAIKAKPNCLVRCWMQARCLPGEVVTLVTLLRRTAPRARGWSAGVEAGCDG